MFKRYSKSDFNRKKILVVGDIMLDKYWFGDAQRISPEAPVPIVKVTKEEERLGGAGNVALNIRNLGAQVKILAVLGNDDAGWKIKTLLEKADIEPILEFDSSAFSITKLRVLARNQQIVRCDFEEKPKDEILLHATNIFRNIVRAVDVVLFSDYGKGGVEHIREMISIAQENNKIILVDPKGKNYDKYSGATIITPNLAELRAVVGDWSSEGELAELAQNLRNKLNLKYLLLTRSEDGMTLFDENGSFSVRASAKEVFDVSGAGDTAIATLAVLMSVGLDIKNAVKIANKASGYVVGKVGTSPITYDELFFKDI